MTTQRAGQWSPMQEEDHIHNVESAHSYGSADAPNLGSLTGKPTSLMSMAITWMARFLVFLLPWLVFLCIYAAMGFASVPGLAWFIFALGCLVVVISGGLALVQRDSGSRLFDVALTLCFLNIIAVILGAVLGSVNYHYNVNPFYRTSNMEYHRNVDPGTATHSSYKDAGMLSFVENYGPSRSLSAGFKAYHIYCVTPVVPLSGNNTAPFGAVYNVWAVGTDCCTEDARDFHCGAWASVMAHGGVRELNPVHVQYYKLAVQKAEAIHEIKAPDPIFIHWVANAPHVAHEEFMATGIWYFHLGLGLHLVFQFFVMFALVFLYKKI